MSVRAWVVLVGMVILSLFLAVGIAWALERPQQVEARPLLGPTFTAPWPRWERAFFPGSPPPREPGRRLPLSQRRVLTRAVPMWAAGRVLATEIFYFLVGFLLFSLVPGPMQRMTSAMRAEAGLRWQALGIGVVVALLVAILSVLATFSAVGLLFLGPLLIFFNLLVVVGFFVAAAALGSAVRRLFQVPDDHWVFELALGVVVLAILGLIPFLGWLFVAFALLWGVGAVFATRLGTLPVEPSSSSSQERV